MTETFRFRRKADSTGCRQLKVGRSRGLGRGCGEKTREKKGGYGDNSKYDTADRIQFFSETSWTPGWGPIHCFDGLCETVGNLEGQVNCRKN